MKIDISGEIVGNGLKMYDDDFCPQDFKDAIEGLQDGEEIELHITSPGGSVLDGNVIISSIREVQKNGHKVVSYVHGIAASMASVIACACDELHIDSNAVMMCHLPWSFVEGNANDMKKEIEILDMLTKSIVSVYKTKFDKSEEEIMEMLENETWILGEDAKNYGLNCVVEDSTSEPLKIAAKYTSKFKNTPKRFIMTNEEDIVNADAKPMDVSTEVVEEPKVVEANAEPVEKDEDKTDEEPTVEELKAKIAELEKANEELHKECEELKKKKHGCEEDMVTKDECEKRISGVQSSFQKKLNDLTEQFNFKDKELIDAKSEISSLNEKLNKSQEELSKLVASLEEKTLALASLNAAVLKPSDELPTFKEGLANCHSPAEKVAFINSKKYKI